MKKYKLYAGDQTKVEMQSFPEDIDDLTSNPEMIIYLKIEPFVISNGKEEELHNRICELIEEYSL